MKSLHLLQAEYWQSEVSIISARNMVIAKCNNMRHLMHAYAANRPADIRLKIAAIESRIKVLEIMLSAENSRQKLMLLEARATKQYWKAFALLGEIDIAWHRRSSRSRDSLNRILSIGYHWLGGKIHRALEDAGMSHQIGFLHAPKLGSESLVYDMEELFRQPIVDRTTLAILARHDASEVSPGLLIAEITARWSCVEWHAGKLKTWDEILREEILALKKSIIAKKPHTPHSMPWTHRAKNKRLPKES